MRIHLWGTDFRRATSDFRNRLWIDPPKRAEFVERALNLGFTDFIYLATCNRIEFFTTAPTHTWDSRRLWIKLLNSLGLQGDDFYRGYHLEGKSALRHLLRVASSLESMVIGEPQILGQLKECIRWNDELKFPLSNTLRKLFEFTFEVSKKVRTETELGQHCVSVASIAFEAIRKAQTRVAVEKVVLVGRSEMTRQMAVWIQDEFAQANILWVNRDPAKLKTIFENSKTKNSSRYEVASLSSFLEKPCDFSHLITSTASRDVIFDVSFLNKIENRKCVIVDLAEPYDVDWQTAKNRDGIVGINLPNIQILAEENTELRKMAVYRAEAIIDAMLGEYLWSHKEAPIMKQFNIVEPEFKKLTDEFRVSFLAEEKTDTTFVSDQVEKLMKKSAHRAREILRHAIRESASQDELGSL